MYWIGGKNPLPIFCLPKTRVVFWKWKTLQVFWCRDLDRTFGTKHEFSCPFCVTWEAEPVSRDDKVYNNTFHFGATFMHSPSTWAKMRFRLIPSEFHTQWNVFFDRCSIFFVLYYCDWSTVWTHHGEREKQSTNPADERVSLKCNLRNQRIRSPYCMSQI